jgi:DNA-binding beta-propeller fold protein YncE
MVRACIRRHWLQFGSVLLAGLLAVAPVAAAGTSAHASKAVATGARPGRAATVYVPALGRLTPINAATNRRENPVTVPGFPFAMAVTPDGRRAYVASLTRHNKYGLVTPVYLRSRRAGSPVKVAPYPEYVAVTPDGATVYVASQIDGRNQYPGRITPISVNSGKAGKPIRVGIDPGPILFTPDGATAYILNYGFNSQSGRAFVTPIDVAAGRAGKPIPLPASDNITDAAMAPDGKTVYLLGSYTAGPPPTSGAAAPTSAGTGAGALAGAARTPGSGATPGRLLRISTTTNRVGKPIKLPGDPLAFAVSPTGHLAYVITGSVAGTGQLAAIPINLSSGRLGRPVKVGSSSALVAFTPDGRFAYVLGSREITPIRVSTDVAERTIRAVKAPVAIAFTPDGARAFVVDSPFTIHGDRVSYDRSWVYPIAVGTDHAGKPIPAGRGALTVAVVP